MSIICENFCDNDKGLWLFKTIFGDQFIEAFYLENTPNPAFVSPEHIDGQLSLAAIIASNVSLASLFIIGLIFFSGALKWVIDSANDGEALGKKGGATGAVARPIFAVLMITPTFSKFAVINIITLYFALWGHGFANKAYSHLIVGSFDTGILQLAEPEQALAQASDLSGAVFAGALSQYCASYAANAFGSSFAPPVFSNSRLVTTDMGTVTKDYKAFGELFRGSGMDLNNGKVTIANTASYQWVETGGNGLNSSGPICGEVTFTEYLNPFPANFANASPNSDSSSTETLNWAARRLAYLSAELGRQLSESKYLAAQQAYEDGMLLVQGQIPAGLGPAMTGTDVKTWSVDLDLGRAEAELDPTVQDPSATGSDTGIVVQDGNSLPDPVPLILASNYRTNQLNEELRAVLANNGFQIKSAADITKPVNLICSTSGIYGESENADKVSGRGPGDQYESTMCDFLSQVYSGGWINAAPAREKIKQYKMSAGNNLSATGISYSTPSFLVANPDDEEQVTKAIIFQTAISSLRTQALATRTPALSANSVVRTDNIADASLAGATNAKEAIIDKLDNTAANMFFSIERTVIEFATGSGKDDGVDALTRMQTFGVGLNYAITAYDSFKFYYTSGLTAASMGCSLTPGLFKSMVYDCGSTVNSLKFAFKELFVETLDSTFRMLSVVAAYFSVFIPTMPFVFLLMAVIGWFIQVFQTIIGMLLWVIMHSIPGSDFIGGQQHGYFALISLFFRPLIIISGFFLAFELYDPVITLLVQGYFDMHMAVVSTNSSGGLFMLFEILSTWTLHLFVLANLILAATYLVFGLIQELSDTTLEFMGTRVFAGFGNQETKSVAQGASAGGLREVAQTRQGMRNSTDRLKATNAEQAQNNLKQGNTSLQSGGVGADRSATGTISNNESGGANAGDDGGTGTGANTGGGTGFNTGGGAGGGRGNATATNNASDAGGADPFAINREAGYTPASTSSMIPGMSDAQVHRGVEAYDKKNTFGTMGSKSTAAAVGGASSAYRSARADGGGVVSSMGSAVRGGLEARSQFKSEATAGHKERMEALRSGNDRGYNAMSLKHAQEGVAGTSMSNFDTNRLSSQRRFQGSAGQTQLSGFSSAIEQAQSDADMLPSRSQRSAVG